MTTSTLVTADELLRRPSDGYCYELVNGELRRMSPAGHVHGRVALNVATSLAAHVKSNALGRAYAAETGFKLASNPDHVRAPDVAFVSAERAARVPDGPGFFPGPPDLAVEVISPTDTFADVEAKVLDWLRAGARMVLVVNPVARTATLYRSLSEVLVITEGGTIDGGDVVPGWRLSLADALA